MTDFLKKICEEKISHILNKKKTVPIYELEDQCSRVSAPRGFFDALMSAVTKEQYGLIAEIKKASPSKGIIRQNFDPAWLAEKYQSGGASCLSVLTDKKYFHGEDAFLSLARNSVSLPVLRKDFIIDPYQIIESRALGADCILLILAALSDQQAAELEDTARGLNLDVLLEVHNLPELSRALRLKSKMIGINNRNLKTLEVDLKMTEELAEKLPSDFLVISESGLFTPIDLARMAEFGVKCFLIGEAFMREDDVELAVRKILA